MYYLSDITGIVGLMGIVHLWYVLNVLDQKIKRDKKQHFPMKFTGNSHKVILKDNIPYNLE